MSKKNGRFSVPRKTCVLVLTGDYEGAEARCRLDVGMKTYFIIAGIDTDDKAQIIAACRLFGDEILIEWNLKEDGGEDIPATADGFMSLPPDLCLAMIQAWSAAMTGIPAPLGEGSPSSKEDSQEPSMTESV